MAMITTYLTLTEKVEKVWLEDLGAKLKQVQQHIHDWLSYYQRRNHTHEPRAGESILGKLDGVVDIIGYYLIQLKYANDHNIYNFNR